MIKKIAVISVLALALGFGVFGTVYSTHAQQVEAEEAPAAQVMTQEEAVIENQYTYQYGDGNGEAVSTMTQSRVRTQTRELQDGECDGEPIQRQVRTQLNLNQNETRQLRQNLRDGSCNGACRLTGQGQ